MVSDQELAEALESLLRQANPNTPFTSLHDVVQQLESKLGLDLSQKVEFIRNQIHFLFRPQPPPQQQQQQQQQPQEQQIVNHRVPPPQKDQFALPQTHVFRPTPSAQNFALHRPEEFVFRPQQSAAPPVNNIEAYGSTASAANTADIVASAVEQPAETSKESAQKGKKRRGGPGGLNKLCGVSPLLQAIVGHPALPRTEIVKQLWAYIRKNNLQDPSNKRKIICNDELRLVFETDCTDMFKMNKLLAKHIIPLEPSKQTGQNSKKLKANIESESKSADSVPIVIISEALANFFGTSEREMSQAEVLRQVWEYIKVNQLEDPLNAMVILCDAKLQELLGCESVSALGIPEMLARHHLFKRS